MKKIFFALILIISNILATQLKIFNVPNNTTIYIDNKEYPIKDNKLIVNIKNKKSNSLFFSNNKHKLKIENPNFHTLNKEIELSKPLTIILNKTEGYKLKPIKTYYKNIVIDFEGKKYGCNSNGIRCIAELDDKKFYDYNSKNNVYTINDKQQSENFYIKVKSKDFYSESTTDDALKDSLITFNPISNWGSFFMNFGFSILKTSDFINKDDNTKKLKDYDDEYKNHFGISLGLGYAKNLPFINIFIYSNIQYIYTVENSNDNEGSVSKTTGPIYSIGIGKTFVYRAFNIYAGISKFDLTYKNDLTEREFTYTRTQPFIKILIGMFSQGGFEISVTKNLYQFGMLKSF